jgi:hypothetical protein
MLFYESHHEKMYSSLDPNCTSAMGGQNLTPRNESSPVTKRKQAFASEGDEIFLPNSSSDLQQHFHRPFESNPFLSAPSAPLENPFSNSSFNVATAGNNQTSTSLLQSMAQGDSKHSSHGSTDGSSHLSVRPFGNNDTRHSSPCLSVESSSVLTNQSSQPNTNLHINHQQHNCHQQQQQQQQQSFVQSQSLPFIPDFRKENSMSSSQENTVKHILQGQTMNSIKLLFSTHVSEAVVVKSESGHWDIRMKLVMFLNSTRNGTVESKATHIVQKRYTDLCNFHELLGLSQ